MRPATYRKAVIERTCAGCVFASRNGEPQALYCANGKEFTHLEPVAWEAERIIEEGGVCDNWIKAFAPSPPKLKPARKRRAQPALFGI
jgi:hypothetical protein